MKKIIVYCPICNRKGILGKLRDHLIEDHLQEAHYANKIVNEMELSNSLYEDMNYGKDENC